LPYVRTRAIVLRCTAYSDSSQVAAVIAPDLGQVHVLAKGSRKPRKDGRTALDVLTHYDVVLSMRRSGHLHLLTEWNVREAFPILRSDPARFWGAWHAAEAALVSTSENPEDGPVHGALVRLLRAFQREEETWLALFRCLADILKATGHEPRTDRCAHCGKSLCGPTRFSPRIGGALCGDCVAADPAAIPVTRGAFAAMSRLAGTDAPAARLKLGRGQRAEIQRAFAEQIQYYLGRPLRTLRFVREAEAAKS